MFVCMQMTVDVDGLCCFAFSDGGSCGISAKAAFTNMSPVLSASLCNTIMVFETDPATQKRH